MIFNFTFILKTYITLLLLLSYLSLFSQTVTYTPSTEDFMNPDRGFYHPFDAKASAFTPLSLSDLISRRTTPYTPYQGNYTVRTSMILRHYILDSFQGVDTISTTFLNTLQTDFDIARQAGVRLILRFSYTIDPNTSCGQAACPPYGDAPKSRVLAHIGILKPYLQSNDDVIAIVQGGFIGVWGENYYTDYFGDPSSLGDGRILNARWQDRIDHLTEMLDAVPSNRMVQVRYPQIKQKYIYGITAPVTSAPMTAAQAHNGSDISRIGFHNDCFLAASDDFGTYWDYGSDNTFPSDQTSILKPYFSDDGKYTGNGGETCADTWNPQNNCAGQAVTDMESLHFSFLNSDYNNEVNNDWETDNCMDEIKKRLGYRFVMLDGTYPSSAVAGNPINFTLNIDNEGFAAPFNERILQMVLRNTTTSNEYKVNISGTNSDTRFWHSGVQTLNGSFTPPSGIPAGDYQLLLHILDTSNNNAIASRPEYSIRMANNNTWESSTGYNDLNHTIAITSDVCLAIDGDFTDWDGISPISNNGSGGLTELKAADDNSKFYIYVGTLLSDNYQIYIDSDDDATGSNEYTNTFWSATGLNFMIENGTLYEYTGTGTNWSWNSLGVVNSIKNSSGVELDLDKSLIGSPAGNINIAMASLDATWTEIGHIPLTNTAASYNPTSYLVCGCTDEDLVLSGNQSTAKYFETDGFIESTQTISGNYQVSYDAEDYIDLKVGFRVFGNVDFHAFIDGCDQPASRQSDVNTAILEKTLIENKEVNISGLTISPNPFKDEFILQLELNNSNLIDISIYNSLGEKILQPITSKKMEEGTYSFSIRGEKLIAGIYFIGVKSGNELLWEKVIKYD